MIVVICGKSGAGKSTLARKIIEVKKEKVVHLDIDKIGHKILLQAEVKDKIMRSFGKGILEKDIINRKKLSSLVFNSKENMEILTKITWPYMELVIDKFICDNQDKMILLDWQLLPKTKYFLQSDLRILLDIPYEKRLKRAIERDCITEEIFTEREKASLSVSLDEFDLVINDNEEDALIKVLKRL